MEEEELIYTVSEGRLTPRLMFICDVCGSFPIDSVFAFFDEGERLGIMDVCAMEKDEFSNPLAADLVKAMALQTDSGRSSISLRVSPAAGKLPAKVSSVLRSDVRMKVRPSIFDVVSPAGKQAGGSKDAELDAKSAAVASLLAYVDDAQRELLMDGYAEMPPALRQRLLTDAVAQMGSVGALSQCARVLHKADCWMRARFSASHGFRMRQGIVMWFLYDHAIHDADGYHISEYVRGGLVFAMLHLKLPIAVQEDVVAAFSKRPLHTPVPAASASVRLVLELLGAANDARRNTRERYYAAAFVVKALAALRGIDAQRSSLKRRNALFFVACAWNSKKKRAMVWACPNSFMGHDIIGNLSPYWKHDYLFPRVTGRRGCSLADSTGFGDSMAPAAKVLELFRGLGESVGMPPEAARVMRRHSWRHFAANVTRVAEFSRSDREQVGRWGSLEHMPTRYAQEVEEVTMMAIILRVEAKLREALERALLREWPWLAGWERLSPHVLLRPEQVVEIPLACEPEQADRSDDDEDSDVDEDDVLADGEPGGSAGGYQADEVLLAWDTLKRDKIPARVMVGPWAVEFVPRKVAEGSAGDCYAKRAGRPRVRSRKALCAELGMDATGAVAAGADGEAAAGGEEPTAGVGQEDATLAGDGARSAGGTRTASTAEAVGRAGGSAGGEPAVPVAGGTGGGSSDEDSDRPPGAGGGEALGGEVAAGVPGAQSKRRRPGVPLWATRMGGFPDGDTSLSPPKRERRSGSQT